MGRQKVLVCSDEADFIAILKNMLEGKAGVAGIFNEINRIIRWLSSQKFDLVIIDEYRGLEGEIDKAIEAIERVAPGQKVLVFTCDESGTDQGNIHKMWRLAD